MIKKNKVLIAILTFTLISSLTIYNGKILMQDNIKHTSITRGGTLNCSQAAKWSSLDPTFSTGRGNEKFIINQLYETLIDVDMSGNYIPGLAESWEVKDDKTIILKLQKGVKFHDGTDFNAYAVKFNLDRALDPATKAVFLSEIKDIRSVEALDEYTVKLHLNAPSSALLGSLANYAGYMISPAAITKYGDDIVRNPVGTGPFKFKEAVEGDHITLVRNENYHIMGKDGDLLPYIDELNIKIIPYDSVKLEKLMNGSLDLIDSIQTSDIKTLSDSKDFTIVPTSTSRAFKILLNVTMEPLSKKEVRQAIAYAMDRNELVKAVCDGYGLVEPFITMNNQWFYSPVQKYGFNLDKARELMVKAGYPDGFNVKLSFTSREPDKTIIQLIKAQLEKVGIKSGIEEYDRLAFNDLWYNGEGEIGQNFASVSKPDPYMQFQIYFATNANNNMTKYSNKEYDEILEKSKQTYDVEKRKAMYKQLQEILLEDSPEVFLFQLPLYEAHNKKLQDFKADNEGGWILREAWIKK